MQVWNSRTIAIMLICGHVSRVRECETGGLVVWLTKRYGQGMDKVRTRYGQGTKKYRQREAQQYVSRVHYMVVFMC